MRIPIKRMRCNTGFIAFLASYPVVNRSVMVTPPESSRSWKHLVWSVSCTSAFYSRRHKTRIAGSWPGSNNGSPELRAMIAGLCVCWRSATRYVETLLIKQPICSFTLPGVYPEPSNFTLMSLVFSNRWAVNTPRKVNCFVMSFLPVKLVLISLVHPVGDCPCYMGGTAPEERTVC